MNAGFFNVLHDAGDDHVFARRDSASTSTSMASSRKWSMSTGRSCEYSTASRHVADDHRIRRHGDRRGAPAGRDSRGAAPAPGYADDGPPPAIAASTGRPRIAARRRNLEIRPGSLPNGSAVLGQVNGRGRRADDGHTRRLAERWAKLRGVCPPNWTIMPTLAPEIATHGRRWRARLSTSGSK